MLIMLLLRQISGPQRASTNSLFSLTGHWIRQDFVRKHEVLNASSFVGQRTTEAIKNEINRILTAWEVEDKALTIFK